MSFFDDDGHDTETGGTEATPPPRRGRGSRRRPSRPRPEKSRGRPRPRRDDADEEGGVRRGGGGGAGAALQRPGARLLVVVAGIALLILVLALVIRDCQRDRLVDSYRSYVTEGVTPVATQSAEQGKQLLTTLQNARRQQPEALQQQVRALAREAEKLVDQAQGLNPPGKLSEPHRSMITALRYRVTGLDTLAAELPNAAKSRDVADASARIADRMQRLLASDVIYEDSFVGPARQALDDDNIEGVEIPEASFLQGATANFVGPAGARTLLTQIKGGGATRQPGQAGGDQGSTGLRGTGIVSVKVLPEGKQLVAGQTTQVTGSGELQWQVTIENGGDLIENGIKIKATLNAPNSAPQSVEGEIETIAPKEEQSVSLPIGELPSFGDDATLTVEVTPVENETRTDNNTAKYTVRFVLG